MKLDEELDRLTRELSIRIPPSLRADASLVRQHIIKGGRDRSALRLGDRAPAFTLPNTRGEEIALNTALSKGPVVLSFYRGGWCEYCNLELRALQDSLERHAGRLKDLGGTLYAISPQTVEQSLRTAEKNRLTFDILSDRGNAVARSYGLVHALDPNAQRVYAQFGAVLPTFNGDDSWELPHPATFVIDPQGIIAWVFVNADYTKRAEPDEVLKVLQETIEPHA